MAMPVIQPSFAAGELAPSLYARVDLAKFHVGAALCATSSSMRAVGRRTGPARSSSFRACPARTG
jgi:hypothetical protein